MPVHDINLSSPACRSSGFFGGCQAERFLLLGSLLAVVLAGIAIALSAHRFADRHLDHIALLKTVGATPQTIDRLFIGMFVLLGLTTTFAV